VTAGHGHPDVDCLSHQCHCFWNAPATASPCSHLMFGLHKRSGSIDECQCLSFFPRGRIQWHPFASCILPCQTPFCQIAPLLLCVIWQQNVMKCWQEGWTSTATSPTYTSDVMGQHNKMGGSPYIWGMSQNTCSLSMCFAPQPLPPLTTGLPVLLCTSPLKTSLVTLHPEGHMVTIWLSS